MQQLSNNFPDIYTEQAKQAAQLPYPTTGTSYDQVFNPKVTEFIKDQSKQLPFTQKIVNNVTVDAYSRQSYYSSSTISINNSVNVHTPGSVQAQNRRDNQVAALLIASVVTVVATFLAAKYVNEYSAINTNIDDLKDFKRSIPKNSSHEHVEKLHKIVKLKMGEFNSAKNYIIAKSAIVISALVSGLFLGISALAAPELMAIGAIATGLSLLAGVFVWTLEAYRPGPEKVARTVRDLLNSLKGAAHAVPYSAQQQQTQVPAQGGNGKQTSPAVPSQPFNPSGCWDDRIGW